LALFGLAWPEARRDAALLIWLTPLLLVASAVIALDDFRYRVPADPFLIVLAALALVRIGRRLALTIQRHSVPRPAPPSTIIEAG